MKLNTLKVENFRCYKKESFQFHPEFNLIVGQNATGKTAVLDAISVAIATWLLGFKKKNDKQPLEPTDATLRYVEKQGEPQFVEEWPVLVSATGSLSGKMSNGSVQKHLRPVIHVTVTLANS